MSDFKRENGQFFTIKNPFVVPAFSERFSLIPHEYKQSLLEPFAGSNNITLLVENVKDIINYPHSWHCFDIDTSHENKNTQYPIIQQDTIKNYPQGYHVAITNPPYLAKNSATRRNLNYEYPEYEDMYQKCLEVMLNNTDFVAAIIPESFINTKLFTNRLYSFVSLTCKMFEDTDCPVCLALFIPLQLKNTLGVNDFTIYQMNKKIGAYTEINQKIKFLFSKQNQIPWKFNDKKGEIGIICIDNTKIPSIEFIKGDKIDPNNIKISSRSLTRVSGLPKNISLESFLGECNHILKEYRTISSDIGLTSFKGLRRDGFYRRRLDFHTAKMIMNTACYNITGPQGLR